MDQMPSRENGFSIDLEIGVANEEEVGDAGLSTKVGKTCFSNGCSGFMNVGGLITEEAVQLSGCVPNSNGILLENVQLLIDKKAGGDEAADPVENKLGKERRKTTSAKKPPRPPRPPKALSLDAADQKLMKEIAELAMMKRAKVERMKALKKVKAAKASASAGNFLGMLFTLIFCLVIVFQGMCPGRNSIISFQGSPELAQVADSSFISVHYLQNTSANNVSTPGSGSSSLVDRVLGSDPTDNGRKLA